MQQTGNLKGISTKQNLNCEVHPECQLQIFYLGENKQKKSRILCVKCIIECSNREEKLYPYIYLDDFVNNPVNTLLNILKINKKKGKRLSESQILDEMEQQVQEFEQKMKKLLTFLRQNIEQMRGTLEEFSQEFRNQLELNDIVKQIQLLRSMDCSQGTNEIKQLEDQLDNLSDNIDKINISVKYKVYDNQNLISKNLMNNLQIIKNDMDSMITRLKENLNKVLIPLNDDIKEFPYIHYKISEGKSIQFQQIYQGSKDGLNAQSYWNKCNLQSHLLTIMTSKNGNKFGSYSPCQINLQINNYIGDLSLKTFLFQYNKKEIYQLKDSQNAMYCSPNYGPNYGKRNDVQILTDFIGGCSNIGDCYDASNYNILDKKTHIFGEATPQLKECKVYKIIFD